MPRKRIGLPCGMAVLFSCGTFVRCRISSIEMRLQKSSPSRKGSVYIPPDDSDRSRTETAIRRTIVFPLRRKRRLRNGLLRKWRTKQNAVLAGDGQHCQNPNTAPTERCTGNRAPPAIRLPNPHRRPERAGSEKHPMHYAPPAFRMRIPNAGHTKAYPPHETGASPQSFATVEGKDSRRIGQPPTLWQDNVSRQGVCLYRFVRSPPPACASKRSSPPGIPASSPAHSAAAEFGLERG